MPWVSRLIWLGHLLFEESPLSFGKTIVAHAHAQNPKPLAIIQDVLQFQKTADVKIPKEKLPGLLADEEGFVRGSEFMLQRPATLDALAAWSREWKRELNDGSSANIDLREGVTLNMWADAFLAMR
jgi:hypothetical protein